MAEANGYAPRYCIDCKYYSYNIWDWVRVGAPVCNHYSNITFVSGTDLVSGKHIETKSYSFTRCKRFREERVGHCGPQGQYYDPK